MATWDELAEYVRAEYEVLSDKPGEIRLLYTFDEESDRTQVMIVAREELDRKYEWVQIATPLGLARNVDLYALLDAIGHTTVSGGAAIMGDHIVIRHSLPLENLDINEFTDPLTLIAGAADELESEFFGGDEY
ncbi:type III secretion system chaperone family protein [Kibdelosporangium aridum]|uniref:YbjN domain-containing protein n=1 Tax=Kibdelosporangium aridum TaxID=2030 RepID=A0A1Y5XWQ4_KIBAR|nr:hypothetical protein [Kibdelosporangium aridum]SMD17881.1 hypothetical protein SAMN05661093_05641 [Kibdelosporangium aridum]